MATPQIDDNELRTLAGAGLSQTAIAKRLGVSRATVQRRLQQLDLAPAPEVSADMSTPGIHTVDSEAPEATAAMSTPSMPDVYKDILFPMLTELQELAAWWRERKAALLQAQDEGRETRRVTFFVEKRWEDAIRRQSDLDGMTYTQIVNEAFRQYFAPE